MVIRKAEFVKSAVKKEQYPLELVEDGIDISFAGRSNVGKSSLINALVNRKALAKRGKTPGVTSLINFFNINDAFYLVDLPGYGYAETAKKERSDWGTIINTYLEEREQLKMVILLVDIRHAPSKDDCAMYNWIRHSGLNHIVAATKLDKIKRSQLSKRLKEIKDVLQLPGSVPVVPVSSTDKKGIEEIWAQIETALNAT